MFVAYVERCIRNRFSVFFLKLFININTSTSDSERFTLFADIRKEITWDT